MKGQGRSYRKNNEESYRDTLERYQQSEKGKANHRERGRKQRENGYMKEYQQKNRDKMRKYSSYRFMNKEHSFTNEQWESCKEYFGNSCAYCGIEEEEAKLTQGNFLHKEHVAHNGSNDIDNCVPACKSCNSRKWTFNLTEWYNENNEDYTEERLTKINNWLNNDYKKAC